MWHNNSLWGKNCSCGARITPCGVRIASCGAGGASCGATRLLSRSRAALSTDTAPHRGTGWKQTTLQECAHGGDDAQRALGEVDLPRGARAFATCCCKQQQQQQQQSGRFLVGVIKQKTFQVAETVSKLSAWEALEPNKYRTSANWPNLRQRQQRRRQRRQQRQSWGFKNRFEKFGRVSWDFKNGFENFSQEGTFRVQTSLESHTESHLHCILVQ